jgi:hypothetical protein
MLCPMCNSQFGRPSLANIVICMGDNSVIASIIQGILREIVTWCLYVWRPTPLFPCLLAKGPS